MIHLAIWIASALFLAWVSLIGLGLLAALFSPKKTPTQQTAPPQQPCLNKAKFSDHDPRTCRICLGGGHVAV